MLDYGETTISETFDLLDQTTVGELVYESYQITQRTLRTTREQGSMWIIGAALLVAHTRGIKVTSQTPSAGKRFATDDKLERLGWRVPGVHARDAARHALLYQFKRQRLQKGLFV